MSRARTPAQVAKTTGRTLHDPGRYKGRSNPKVKPLGAAPDYLSETEAGAWDMFADEMPWLAKSDRAIVEQAARLRSRMMTDPDMGVNALAQLRMTIQALGGTPSDRTKVSVPDEEEQDPADEYLN